MWVNGRVAEEATYQEAMESQVRQFPHDPFDEGSLKGTDKESTTDVDAIGNAKRLDHRVVNGAQLVMFGDHRSCVADFA